MNTYAGVYVGLCMYVCIMHIYIHSLFIFVYIVAAQNFTIRSNRPTNRLSGHINRHRIINNGETDASKLSMT